MDRWFGRVAVVTGAAGSIGSATALQLAKAGFDVIGIDLDAKMVKEVKIPGRGSIIPRGCDLTQQRQIAETFQWIEERFGGTDLLVNIAGLKKYGHITEVGLYTLSDEDISSIFDVNITAVIQCTRHAVASMKKRGFPGHIINICSIEGHYTPTKNVYTSTMHAVRAFTESLAVELADFNSTIKTTNISRGIVLPATAPCNGVVVDGAIQPLDIADAVLYAVSTLPHVNISELTIQAVGEKKF